MNLPEGPIKYSTRTAGNTAIGKMRGGKFYPVMCEAVRPLEGGVYTVNITAELDPIPGRLITPPTFEAVTLFIPVQAIDLIKDPEAAYAGMTEVIREKLLSGNPLFGLEDESEISRRCNIHPKSIAGVKKVSEMPRLAHNAAINFLRQRKYVKAATILHSNTALTPALIGNTVLDRLNGVLDPDDRINGMVNLEIPQMTLPVKGMLFRNTPSQPSGSTFRDGDGTDIVTTGSDGKARNTSATDIAVKSKGSGATSTADLTAVFDGAAQGVSLIDFYNAETMDRLTREMEQIVKAYPQFGTEYVLRWAHGLRVDDAKLPFVLAEVVRPFMTQIKGATDTGGVEDDVMRTDNLVTVGFNVPIPKTELGGVIMTFLVLKPDETLAAQPHPFLSEPWGLDNYVSDQLALDPVAVTIREIDGDCLQANETTVALYTGYNQLKRSYSTYGFNRYVDPNTVENKSQIWQLEIPVSVTPENILYPASLDHYPFADTVGEICTYRVSSTLAVRTPIVFGPTPVETVDIIEDEDIFDLED